jgi:hypothetical protein
MLGFDPSVHVGLHGKAIAIRIFLSVEIEVLANLSRTNVAKNDEVIPYSCLVPSS